MQDRGPSSRDLRCGRWHVAERRRGMTARRDGNLASWRHNNSVITASPWR